MELINLVPTPIWWILAGLAIGGILRFIYIYIQDHLKMKDLEPVRKNAKSISETPEEIKSIGNRVGTLETKVSFFESNILTALGNITREIKALSGQKFMKAESPISLNSKGIELSEKMDAYRIANKYKEKLLNKAKKENRNPYQIQQSCFDFATNKILEDLEEKDKKTFDHLTNIAYNEGVRVEALMQIIGLVLRDQVLKALSQSSMDIDKNETII